MFTRMNEAFKTRLFRGKETDKGFTLIELLVVVLIIGILSAIAIPIFLNQQANAKDKATMAQVTNAKTAVAVALVAGEPSGFTMDNAPEFTQSAEIPVVITWAGTASTGDLAFCISGMDTEGEHRASIDDKGAVMQPGVCSGAVATAP